MKRLILPAALVLATLGVVHPHGVSASNVRLHSLNLIGEMPKALPANAADPPISDVIQAAEYYCTDGTTTCGSTPATVNAVREADVVAGFYGSDPSRAYPFSGGATPDYMAAGCLQEYVAPNGDIHEQQIYVLPGPAVNNGQSDTGGTIAGKAVLLPNDTESNTFAESAVNLSGTDPVSGATLNYARGNQYTNNVTDQPVGGSGFQISLTGPIQDFDDTSGTMTTYQGTLTCSTGHRQVQSGTFSEAVINPDGDEYPG